MKSLFSAAFFAANRQRLLEEAKSEYVVVAANGLLQRGADTTYPFQQDANFWYLTGINEPDIILVFSGKSSFLIVPSRTESREAFDGTVSLNELTKRSGISSVLESEAGWAKLTTILKKQKQIGTIAPPPSYLDPFGFYTNPARERLQQQLLKGHDKLELEDVMPILRTHRAIKQPAELKAMQTAIDITSDSLRDAVETARKMKFTQEYELEATIAHGFRSRGARGHAFEPIVAAGKQACTLHYIANDHPIQSGEMIVLDVGAEVEQYAADITRTVNLAEPSRRQREIFEAVLEVQAHALSLLKPGVMMREYEQAVQAFITQKLLDLKIIKTADPQAVRKYYPHATSHFLGLNVHDVGNYDQPLEANMVITVEPGIYVPEEGIGVRIEDDVLITKTGTKVLSAALPSKL
jgi:Xaa-Pro aminopeptidase